MDGDGIALKHTHSFHSVSTALKNIQQCDPGQPLGSLVGLNDAL